ncbi:MAG: nucleoside hydrolase [Rikenellaceae bacterium]|nr:nucleoside hydrolase [Rikenellaceae bacterium]
MKRLLVLLSVVLGIACARPDGQPPVSVIFDTDMAPDYDDVGAIAVLHALADSGEVQILGTVTSNRTETAVPCIEVLNNYFGRPDLPVGAPKGIAPDLNTWHRGLRWTEELPARFRHRTARTSDAPDAVQVYRQILSAQPDTSVTIVTVGFLSNLRDLLASEPDSLSPLGGRDLVSAKVRKLVSMAGVFPEGKEFNVMCDSIASAVVFSEWPTPVVLSGFEIGDKVITGARTATMDAEGNPVRETYAMCLAQDDPAGRCSWDQTTVLVAVRGAAPYYDTERGTMTVYPDGSNSWTPSADGPHERLVARMPSGEVAAIIEDMMMHRPPRHK